MKKQIIAHASGRINIIGEHTDYNDGFVLPAAIDKKSTFKVWKNGTESTCNILSEHFQITHQFDLKDFQPVKSGWENYVMGVVSELQKLGADLSGFDGSFDGTVPIGSGMSSSAALECSLAVALNVLFDLGFDNWQLIKASQMAEHHFVGIKCGIMDQFASVMGRKNQVMLLDCRSLEFEYFPLELGDYQLLLLDTNVSHSLANSAYNERRLQCEIGVKALQQKYPTIVNLRDVSLVKLMGFKKKLSEVVYNRCKHVISEDNRVLAATKALKAGKLDQLGELIYESHHSLQYNYEVSCKELDFLVDLTRNEANILGSRMMGGGFGGCTINIIKKDFVEEFIEKAALAYQTKFDRTLTPYQVSIEDGITVE